MATVIGASTVMLEKAARMLSSARPAEHTIYTLVIPHTYWLLAIPACCYIVDNKPPHFVNCSHALTNHRGGHIYS